MLPYSGTTALRLVLEGATAAAVAAVVAVAVVAGEIVRLDLAGRSQR